MDDTAAILIIEDEIEIQNLLVRIIESLKYQVFVAKDAEEGLKLLRSNDARFRLIILDLMIPGMTGWDLFPIIRKEWPEVKILISSGFLELGKISAIIDPGKVESLPKPYTITELRHTICRMIEN